MGYYGDLFLRPKQAVQFALQNPSWLRSMGFVILGPLASLLSMLFFAGTIYFDLLLEAILGDFGRWMVGGLLLFLFGILFKRFPASRDSIVRAFSVMAQLSVYGFFLVLVLGILLPALVIPDLMGASQQLSAGIIGQEEFDAAVQQSLADFSNIPLLALPLIGLAFILLLYSIYVLFLSVQKFLDTTVFKAVVAMIIILLVEGLLVSLITGV